MNKAEREQLIFEPLAGYEPTIARWLWALEDARRRTKRALAALDPATVDWAPSPDRTAIGGLLYHLAVIETDWLYSEILGTGFPPELEALFPYDVRDEGGRLTSVAGVTLDQHLQRLNAVRVIFLNSLRGMTLDEFRRPRTLRDYDVTPEWVLHHLMQHEAEHRAEIAALCAEADRNIAP